MVSKNRRQMGEKEDREFMEKVFANPGKIFMG
jgi:hypothetical protein